MNRLVALAAVAAVLVAAPGRGAWTGGGDSEVRLEGDGESWLVHATLDAGSGKVSGLFLLDTGASVCVLAPTIARQLKLPPGPMQAAIHTANGVVHAPVIRIPTVDIGGNRAHDVMAVVHNAVEEPLAGAIGLSYLNNFQYSIDSKRRILKLH